MAYKWAQDIVSGASISDTNETDATTIQVKEKAAGGKNVRLKVTVGTATAGTITFRAYISESGGTEHLVDKTWDLEATVGSHLIYLEALDIEQQDALKLSWQATATGGTLDVRAEGIPSISVAGGGELSAATTDDEYLIIAGYDPITDSNAVHFSNQAVYSTIADVTNGADGTYDYYVDMEDKNTCGFQLQLDGGSGTVTVKVYGTIQNDGTAAASCDYQDITNDVFGVASVTSSDMLIDDSEKLSAMKYVKVEVVAAASGTADWTIYSSKKMK
jgi:hypothetical protein